MNLALQELARNLAFACSTPVPPRSSALHKALFHVGLPLPRQEGPQGFCESCIQERFRALHALLQNMPALPPSTCGLKVKSLWIQGLSLLDRDSSVAQVAKKQREPEGATFKSKSLRQFPAVTQAVPKNEFELLPSSFQISMNVCRCEGTIARKHIVHCRYVYGAIGTVHVCCPFFSILLFSFMLVSFLFFRLHVREQDLLKLSGCWLCMCIEMCAFWLYVCMLARIPFGDCFCIWAEPNLWVLFGLESIESRYTSRSGCGSSRLRELWSNSLGKPTGPLHQDPI